MRDWFAAFARERGNHPLDRRATGATRATPELTHCEIAEFGGSADVAQGSNRWATRATPVPGSSAEPKAPVPTSTAVAPVAQPLPRRAYSRATTESDKYHSVTSAVARVAPVAPQIDNFLPARHGSVWDAADWRAYFDERAGIAEFDGGLPRARAEAEAFTCCLVEWMTRNPPAANTPDQCAHCGGSMAAHDALPFLNGADGHVWMHDRCHPEWMALRRADAVRALAGFGLVPPAGLE